jgi:hypothetical protein
LVSQLWGSLAILSSSFIFPCKSSVHVMTFQKVKVLFKKQYTCVRPDTPILLLSPSSQLFTTVAERNYCNSYHAFGLYAQLDESLPLRMMIIQYAEHLLNSGPVRIIVVRAPHAHNLVHLLLGSASMRPTREDLCSLLSLKRDRCVERYGI